MIEDSQDFGGWENISKDQEDKSMYSIKELSDMAGVSARTLRWYDRIGLLQQILFYRERGVELKKIRSIIYEEGFDIMAAMEEHLYELEEQKARIDGLIRLVRRSIISMKGEDRMNDSEKFMAFKENVVKKHEEKYGGGGTRKIRRQRRR